MKPLKQERYRVDVDGTSKFVLDDLVDRGFFRDTQSALAAAITALQFKIAEESLTDEYYDEDYQEGMDRLQLVNDE